MIRRFSPTAALILSAGAALLTTGCRKPEIRSYLAPRDATPAPMQEAAHPAPAPKPIERPKPKISYPTLPEGWKETAPGQMSLAAFSVAGESGEASINITPLADLRGRELQVVNMYRQQTGQAPIEEAGLAGAFQTVEAAGGEGKLIEFEGKAGDKPSRLVIVIANRDERSWFYRISGDPAVVAAQKPAFLEFIKKVQIAEAPQDAPAEAPADAERKPDNGERKE